MRARSRGRTTRGAGPSRSPRTKPRDEVVHARPADRQEPREIRPGAFRDVLAAVVADRAGELLQRLIQLARGLDQRIVAKWRERRRGARAGLARVEHALDLVAEPDERELPRDDLLRERLAPPLVLDLHELVRGGERVVARGHHLAHVVRRGGKAQAVPDAPLSFARRAACGP